MQPPLPFSTVSCWLLAISIAFCLNILQPQNQVEAFNATNPLIYTKLRFDYNYLQIYKSFQLKKTNKEKKVTLKVNETLPNSNKTREVELTFYENDQVEATSITQDDLILEALHRTYLTRLMPTNMYNYDNPKERKQASDKSKVSPDRCSHELDFLLAKMDILLNSRDGMASLSPEVAALFDAYASEETGILMGNYHWTGMWRQCAKRRVFELDRQNISNYYDFNNRYCIASIRSPNWETKIKQKAEELKAPVHFKYKDQKYDYARFFRIQVGFCIPESCDSLTLDTKHDEIKRLAMYKLGQAYKNYQLVDLFCLPDETSELRQYGFSTWLFIVTATSWVSLVAFATYYDQNNVINPKDPDLSSWHKVVLAFSFTRNLKKAFETESLVVPREPTPIPNPQHQQQKGKVKLVQEDEGRSLRPNNLLFLNAFKVIGTVCIIFGHCGMMLKHLDRFALDYESLGSDFNFHFNASTVFFVDWFFAMTGILTTYLMFISRRVEKYTLIDWLHQIFHRYWRLAPMYLMVFWFSRSMLKHLGSGAVWDYGTSNMTVRANCQRESWIYPLTLTSNLHPLHDECIMPTWYISNDFQFYLTAPLILIILYKSAIAGWIVGLSIIVGSLGMRIRRYLTDPRAAHLDLMRPRFDLYIRNNWDMHATYISPQYRIGSFIVGLLAGHYAYMVLSGKWSSPLYHNPMSQAYTSARSAKDQREKARKSRWRLIAYIIGTQCILSTVFATWIISDLWPVALDDYVKIGTALIYGTSHTTSALGMSLTCLVLLFGLFPWFKKFLEHPAWTVISRFNFLVFITQVEMIYYAIQSEERPTDMNAVVQFKFWIYIVSSCYMVSFVLTLLFEYPVAQLEREFLARYLANRKLRGQTSPSRTTQHGVTSLSRKIMHRGEADDDDDDENRGSQKHGSPVDNNKDGRDAHHASEMAILTKESSQLFQVTPSESLAASKPFAQGKNRKGGKSGSKCSNTEAEAQVKIG